MASNIFKLELFYPKSILFFIFTPLTYLNSVIYRNVQIIYKTVLYNQFTSIQNFYKLQYWFLNNRQVSEAVRWIKSPSTLTKKVVLQRSKVASIIRTRLSQFPYEGRAIGGGIYKTEKDRWVTNKCQ